MERLRDRAGARRPPGDASPARGVRLALARGGERVLARGNEGGLRERRRAGPRPEYHDDYYGAFLLDPDGNSTEAVYHGRARKGENVVDHLWIRVADLEATKRFYETIAPILGLRISHELEERFHVAARRRSFALVRGEPSEYVHLAFPVPDAATAREFHRRALAAGYGDNGPPGERPRYHPATTAPTFSTPAGTTSRPCTTTVRCRARRGQPGAAR